jgi:uncharacterized protein (TIGR02466 family)
MSQQEQYTPKKSEDENYEIHPIFPIPVYTRENFVNLEDHPYLNELSDLPRAPSFDSNSMYGDRSEHSYILNTPGLWPLKHQITKYINEYANCVLGLAGDYVISQSWLSVKVPGQKHIMHSHGNSIISGTFYFNNNDDAEGLTFIKTEVTNTYQMVPLKNPNVNNQFSFNEVTLKIENNMLCLFPSYLAHKVAGNDTKNDRYCIAFNAVPRYALGFDKELTELEFKRVDRTNDEI